MVSCPLVPEAAGEVVEIHPDQAVKGEGSVSESLRKAMAILDLLRGIEVDISARELAARAELPKSTVQRLLQALEEAQMVVQDPVTLKYRLGPRTLTLGMAYRDQLDLRNTALPHMRRLRDATDETVGLSTAFGRERMFIEEVQSQSELRARTELGRPYPLWTGAPGRVLLSGMSAAEVEEVLPGDDPASGAPAREDLQRELDEVRRCGHARAFDETISGVSAIAVPVRDATGGVQAALSVSGPTGRMQGSTMAEILPHALDAARAISRALGA